MNERGAPTPVAWTRLRAPESLMGPADAAAMQQAVEASPRHAKYAETIDRESAREKLAAKLEEGARKAPRTRRTPSRQRQAKLDRAAPRRTPRRPASRPPSRRTTAASSATSSSPGRSRTSCAPPPARSPAGCSAPAAAELGLRFRQTRSSPGVLSAHGPWAPRRVGAKATPPLRSSVAFPPTRLCLRLPSRSATRSGRSRPSGGVDAAGAGEHPAASRRRELGAELAQQRSLVGAAGEQQAGHRQVAHRLEHRLVRTPARHRPSAGPPRCAGRRRGPGPSSAGAPRAASSAGSRPGRSRRRARTPPRRSTTTGCAAARG